MNTKASLFFLIASIFYAPLGCGSAEIPEDAFSDQDPSENFSKYWNQGLAEVSSYSLNQARYGEMRSGSAVLIFVTEPFSASKQVKLDQASAEQVEVLKLNIVKKFNTGVYPYSMMNSTFSPVNSGAPGTMLKSTTSSQEWCGHSFTQWNKSGNDYRLRQYSYFESEGDVDLNFKNALLEDEVWTLIRINPDILPQGNLELIPGSFYTRLSHVEPKPYNVETSLIDSAEYQIYTLNYPSLNRQLKITFHKEFPYEIEYWEESYRSGWGSSAKTLTTTARLQKRKMLDYWNKNGNEDEYLREELNLGY